MNLQNLTVAQSERNYGIDLLRIVSMMMVVLLHCLGQGGVLSNTNIFSIKYEAVWLLKIMSFCAVNCYGLISGYVGYGRKIKYSNLIYLIIQTTFYTVLITAVFLLCFPGTVGIRTILYACFPIGYNVYWYVTSYFCLFFFMPFLNQLLDSSSKGTVSKLLLTLTFVFCILPTIYQVDIPFIHWGYTPAWLCFLYLAGAYIKKYGLLSKLSSVALLSGYFIFGVGTWIIRVVTEFITAEIFGHPKLEDYFIYYNSPTIFMCSVFLLLYFSRIQPGKKFARLIAFVAPTTFGVYLIHLEPLIWNHIMKDLLLFSVDQSGWFMITTILAITFLIFAVCSLVDKLRIYLFNILKIRKLCVWIEKQIKKALSFAMKHLARIVN